MTDPEPGAAPNLEPETVNETLPPRYFDDIYTAHLDPWNFESSPYEAAKYARTLAALPRETYASGLEIGCSVGVLSALLAPRCRRLLSLDVSDLALERARLRCRALPQVRFERRQVPQAFPDGAFDLIVLSEVLYYLSPADLGEVLTRCVQALTPDGHLIAVHWTPPVHDYPQTGDAVHAALLGTPGLSHLHGERHEQYRLDVFGRAVSPDADCPDADPERAGA